jgi:collagen type V/XI/XXIV/XXVII alpha
VDSSSAKIEDASNTLTLEQVVEQIFENIDDLREEFKEIRLPPGTKESPARTCKDIYLAYPESKDGRHDIMFHSKCSFITQHSNLESQLVIMH